MGNGMNKIVSGLYLGNFRDSRDNAQLTQNCITHIVSIHDNAKPLQADKVYLCLTASDTPSQDLTQYFSQCNDFIHQARLNGGGVLVHCLAGVSRSSTIVVAYLMSVTDLDYRTVLDAVRGARSCASPNFGFQRQLLTFEYEGLQKERTRLVDKFGPNPFSDKDDCLILLEKFRELDSRVAQARGGVAFNTTGILRHVEDEKSTKSDSSADDDKQSSVGAEQSLNYARKAIREITAIGKMRLEERNSDAAKQNSSEKTADGSLVQDSSVSSSSSSSAAGTDKDAPGTETHRSNNANSAAENTQQQSSASAASNGAVLSSNSDTASAGTSTSLEVSAAKHMTSGDVDGIAICLM